VSSGVRMPLPQARAVAGEVLGLLEPACERIAIAGSIRREAPDAGDVELVAISKTRFERDASVLFGEPIETAVVQEHMRTLAAAGILTLDGFDAPAQGERYTKARHVATGLQVDIFTVRPPAQWGVIYLIRTGPASFSREFVAGARRRGFHVGGGALHRGGLGCGAIACEVIDTPEEADVFRAIGLRYIAPEDRR